jgi:hypothetical protein
MHRFQRRAGLRQVGALTLRNLGRDHFPFAFGQDAALVVGIENHVTQPRQEMARRADALDRNLQAHAD